MDDAQLAYELQESMNKLNSQGADLLDDSMNMFNATTSICVIISLLVTILILVAQWKMFKKAGKPGWVSLIPIYNTICLFKIAKMNPWLVLLLLVPVADAVILIMLYINLAKSFGKGIGYALGLIFFNPIFTLILGFGKAEYQN